MRKQVSKADLKVNFICWVECDTYFNGEGGFSGIGIVKSILQNDVEIELLVEGYGLEKDYMGVVIKTTISNIEEGKTVLFIATDNEILDFINRKTTDIEKAKQDLDSTLDRLKCISSLCTGA
jgi:hypothetical protein